MYVGDSNLSFSFSDMETYSKLVGFAYQRIIPIIVKRYVDDIFDKNQAITIGNVEFNKKGYSHPKFWGGTDVVEWKEKIYIPKLLAGFVFLYIESEGKVKQFASIPMTTPNAVVLPMLIQECVNRAIILGLIPPNIAPVAQKMQFGTNMTNGPGEGSKKNIMKR